MTVMHLAHGAGGGAGRAARRAHLATRSAGMLSAFAFAEGTAGPGDILLRAAAPADQGEAALAATLRQRVQWEILPQARRGDASTLFSIPHPGLALDRHPMIAAADILHLHWTSWLAAPALLRRWHDAGRAIVWTLHDLWPMTGGCHYADGCEQFRTACMACPQLADGWSLVPNAFAEKRAGWEGVPLVVAPSAWMAAQAADSAILGGCRIEIVPNAIETDIFAPPPDRDGLRAALGFGPDDLLIIAGAYDNRERRKGGALLAAALARIAADGSLAALLPAGARVALAVFGRSAPGAPTGIETFDLGEMREDAAIADMLGAADLACIPSLEDNYPNLALEALACGTPCVATPAGGLPDLVRDGRSGVLAAATEEEALAAALLRFATDHRGDRAMREACRLQVEAENAPGVVGARLAELYAGIAPRGRAAPPDGASHARAVAALAAVPVPATAMPAAPFLGFPTNLLLRSEAGAGAAQLAPSPMRDDAPRILALQARHAHHGARSGPAQFLRHLPAGQRATSMVTPLGADLAAGRDGDFLAWGRLLRAGPFGQQGNAWLAEAELLAACADAAPDLIHAIDGELALALLARLPAALCTGGRRPRLVATFHQPAALLGAMVAPRWLARLDAAVMLCEAQRPALAGHVAADRLHVIPHGIDTDFFTPGPRADVSRDGVRLLSVGHWLRDHATGFAALAMLRQVGVPTTLRLVTPEPPASKPEGTVVDGGLSDAALRQAYRDADAVLLPLHDATANNAILEAMACGRPVIATDVGGVAEMTQGAARLVPPGDATAIAEAVLDLVEQPASAAALARAARARAEALDWRHVAARHAALYARLTEGHACAA
nr:glycosyltransferase [Neoroseomonas nitratireducens]